MSPRLGLCSHCLKNAIRYRTRPIYSAAYATLQAFTPAPEESNFQSSLPILRYPSTQPPSFKPPEVRRSQLHRQYASLIKSTPLMLIFQHNNLTASEWAAIRRELNTALQKTDQIADLPESSKNLADCIKIQVIKTGVFSAALRVAEYYNPEHVRIIMPEDLTAASSTTVTYATADVTDSTHTHGLSQAAHAAVFKDRHKHPLVPLLNGPIALLTFPSISTEHLKTALSILSPSPPHISAPTRRANPGYYELSVQSGLPKLMLLGARVEGSVFDVDRTRWVSSISGGIDGMRSQLVAVLQNAGSAVAYGLESASRSLYITLDSRKNMLEDEQK